MAVSSTARTSPMAVMPEFKQAEQRIKAQSVNFAGTTMALEGAQGVANVAVGVSDGDSWGALASSVATVLALFGPYGRAAGVALTLIGLLADQIDKQGKADAKMADLQTRLKGAVEGGRMLTDSAAERARKLADQARQLASRNFDAVISDLEKQNAALQAEVAEKRASLANVEANLDSPADPRQRAFNQNDRTLKDRLRNDRPALDDALRRQKEVQEILDKARAEKAAFLEKASDPPPDSELGRILADGAVEQYSRTLEQARKRTDECTGAVKEQAEAVGEDTRARAASEAAIEAQNAALAAGVKLVQEQKDGIIGLSEADAKSQEALKRFQAEVGQVSADLSGVLSNAVWSGLTGDGDTKSILDWFQNLFKRIATEALSTHIILPIVTQTVGGLPGLFGIQAPANQNGAAGQTAAGFGQQASFSLLSGKIFGEGGFTGWLDDIGYSIGIGSPTVTLMPSASVQASQIAMLRQANPDLDPGSLAAGYEAPTATAPGLGLSAYLGAGLGGFSAGTMVGGMLGTSTGSKAVGGLSGVVSGALAGFMLTGNPIGAVVGGIAGGLGGLFGTQKPTVGPNYSYHVAGSHYYDPRVDNGYDPQQAAQQGNAMAATVSAISYLLGGRNNASFGVSWSKNGYQLSNVGGVAGVKGVYRTTAELLQAVLALPGQVIGGDAAMMGVLSRSRADDAEGLVGDLQFAQGVLDLNRGLTQTDIAIRDLNRTYDEQIRKAAELGLETGRLAQQRDKEIAKLQEQRQLSLQDIEVNLAARVWAGRGDQQAADLALFDLQARRQRIELRDQLDALGELTTAFGAEMTRRLEEALALEREAAMKAGDQRLLSAGQSALSVVSGIGQYVRSISMGDMSGLAPEQQFGLAQNRFNAVSGAALAGDFGSLQQVTTYADSLLRAARQQYGSGAGYAETFAQVTDVLSRLAAVDPDQLTQQAFVVETRSQTQTLVTELQALRKEVEMLRREQQQGGNRPARAA